MQHSGKPVIARHACVRFTNRPYGVACDAMHQRTNRRAGSWHAVRLCGALEPSRVCVAFGEVLTYDIKPSCRTRLSMEHTS